MIGKSGQNSFPAVDHSILGQPPRIITDRGKPTIEIKKLRQRNDAPLVILKGSVIRYDAEIEPVAVDAWENA